MNMPGFTAEASLYRTSERYHRVGRPGHARGVVPQQFGPLGFPGAECGPMRPLFTYFEPCSPCRLVRRPPRPPVQGDVFLWRQSVRECTWFESPGCMPSIVCTPCFERSCSPFVVMPRLA
jgi:hypothetical protein